MNKNNKTHEEHNAIESLLKTIVSNNVWQVIVHV